MSTTINKNRVKTSPAKTGKLATEETVQAQVTEMPQGEYQDIPEQDIDFSPLNYRTYISQPELEAFARELKQHGIIISPVMVRVVVSGRYELVVGERRLRAGRLAGFAHIPAIIRVLTDEQVVEIQLAENLQRENPHPMQEAHAIGKMQRVRKTMDEIAARLGKSKAFVFGRLKLLSLLADFQEMFLADHFTLTEALEIATLSTESQQAFYNTYYQGWREKQMPKYYNLRNILSQFKCDLRQAPFDTKDKQLLPDVGACTKCPFNSATLKTLFPDQAKEATCTKRECFERKSTVTLSRDLAAAIAKHRPAALLFSGSPSDLLEKVIQEIPEAAALPTYSRYEVRTLSAPELPSREEYTNEDEMEDRETPGFDEASFETAMDEYNDEMDEYKRLMREGKIVKGLYVSENKIEPLPFDPEPRHRDDRQSTVKAADVQAAIKAGTASPEMLTAEIDRIQTRETRAQELDREKVQEKVHATLEEQTSAENAVFTLTDADQAAARWLVYQSLGYGARHTVEELLFPTDTDRTDKNENFYEVFRDMTDAQFAYLVRMAIIGQSDSKSPKQTTAYFLYKTAEHAGVDVVAIEQEQQQKADTRQEKQQAKIDALEKKIKKMQPTV